MTLKFSEKLDHAFSHVFIFDNMFPESHGFVAMPVTGCIKDTCSNFSLILNKLKPVILHILVVLVVVSGRESTFVDQCS